MSEPYRLKKAIEFDVLNWLNDEDCMLADRIAYAINETVCEELSGYRSLFDTLNLVDPRAVEKAIDIQEDGEKP